MSIPHDGGGPWLAAGVAPPATGEAPAADDGPPAAGVGEPTGDGGVICFSQSCWPVLASSAATVCSLEAMNSLPLSYAGPFGPSTLALYCFDHFIWPLCRSKA